MTSRPPIPPETRHALELRLQWSRSLARCESLTEKLDNERARERSLWLAFTTARAALPEHERSTLHP